MLPITSWQFLAPILAALIAGVVAFIVTVLSKDQKTSEFRQDWIDGLRENISEFLSLNLSFQEAFQMKVAHNATSSELSDYLVSERFVDMTNIESSRTKILLRLNPKEHKKLIALVKSVYAKERPETGGDQRSQVELIEDIINESQSVLKQEWKRVKSGEPVFRVTKWAAFTVVLCSALIAATYLSGHLVVAYAP